MQKTKDILERLRILRVEKDLRQDQVARALGVSRTTYVRKEQGTIPITTEEWVRLAHALGKDPAYFFSHNGTGGSEALVLEFYRALTAEERDDFLCGLNLMFKRVRRKNITDMIESLCRSKAPPDPATK